MLTEHQVPGQPWAGIDSRSTQVEKGLVLIAAIYNKCCFDDLNDADSQANNGVSAFRL
jgi:hypothetical protein